MRPHYSHSSRENATPSSGTSPLGSCKGVPPRGFSFLSSSSSSFFSLFVTANFIGYSRLLGEETSRNHQAYIGCSVVIAVLYYYYYCSKLKVQDQQFLLNKFVPVSFNCRGGNPRGLTLRGINCRFWSHMVLF